MLSLFFSLIVSILLTIVVLSTSKYHYFFSLDDDLNAIQKYHDKPTPRIGGIVIFISFLIVVFIQHLLSFHVNYELNLIVSVVLVFIIGTLEDITKKVTPSMRLIVFVISALSAIYITHSIPVITYADFGLLERLISKFPIIGIALSLFCVVGLTNSYNIIDGYNGLSSTTAMLNLIGLAIISYFVKDFVVARIALILCFSILGFWLFNYPWGKIFLGDGGAYTIGFIISILSIYLVHVHKGMISPYCVLLMAVYPVTEMGFSMYRRKFIHRTRGTQPDNMHLHQLVYHNCVPTKAKNRNALVMPLMLYFMLPPIVLAIIFYNNTQVCLILLVLYIIIYVKIYFKSAKFKTPFFLKVLLRK